MNDMTQIMVLWVDCIRKLRNIPFIDNQDMFFQPVLLSCYCLLCHRQCAFFLLIFQFPVNIWITSFMVYAFYGSTILQSDVYGYKDC